VFQIVKRVRMPLLLVVVIAGGTYAVVRIRDMFGVSAAVASGDGNADNTKPFNPKHITYEITGPAGGSVDVDCLDENGQPHRVDAAPMPWSYTIVTTPLRSSSVL
jgi:Mycobacterium membrane protein